MSLITKEMLEKAFENRKETIDEQSFVKVWLPAFVAGDPDVAVEWIKKVSGHPQSTVVVLDERGEKLFEVPAMAPVLKTGELDNVNMAFKKHEELSRAGYAQADQFLIDTMSTTHGSISTDHLEEWVEILGRYGYMEIVSDEENKQLDGPNNYVENDLF